MHEAYVAVVFCLAIPDTEQREFFWRYAGRQRNVADQQLQRHADDANFACFFAINIVRSRQPYFKLLFVAPNRNRCKGRLRLQFTHGTQSIQHCCKIVRRGHFFQTAFFGTG